MNKLEYAVRDSFEDTPKFVDAYYTHFFGMSASEYMKVSKSHFSQVEIELDVPVRTYSGIEESLSRSGVEYEHDSLFDDAWVTKYADITKGREEDKRFFYINSRCRLGRQRDAAVNMRKIVTELVRDMGYTLPGEQRTLF